jgi:hypothetical protein
MLGCALLMAVEAAAAPVDHRPFDDLLARHVRGQRVDYLALRDEDGARLDTYLAALARVDAAALPGDARTAFEVNLYNATVLRAVCDRYRDGWSVAADDFALFRAPLVRTRDGAISLDALEKQRLLPRTRDPRLHVAVVCGARGCPPLPPRAFHAPDLGATLDRLTRAFVLDTSRNRVDPRRRRLALSRIFEWYAADFGGAGAVAAWVGQWRGEDLSGHAVEFRDYDWSLNLASPREGDWRVVRAATVPLHASPGAPGRGALTRGEVVRVLAVQGEWTRLVRPGGGEAWTRTPALAPWRAPD